MASERKGDAGLLLLDAFSRPQMPARERFRKLFGHFTALVPRHNAKPFIATDVLREMMSETTNEIVSPPPCGPLLSISSDQSRRGPPVGLPARTST